jgi:hypothetical protein
MSPFIVESFSISAPMGTEHPGGSALAMATCVMESAKPLNVRILRVPCLDENPAHQLVLLVTQCVVLRASTGYIHPIQTRKRVLATPANKRMNVSRRGAILKAVSNHLSVHQ